MNQNEQRFIGFAAEVFDAEPEEIRMETVFREELEDFSSMVGFAVICMIEDEYGYRMPVDEFLACRTVGDLYRAASEKGKKA